MSCASTQFSTLPFCVTYEKPYVVRGLSKDYHLLLDPKLGNGKCAIIQNPCACNAYTNILETTWAIGVDLIDRRCYKTFEDCTYWPVLGSFKIGTSSNFITNEEDAKIIDEVHKAVLDGISENMSSLVKNVNMLQSKMHINYARLLCC